MHADPPFDLTYRTYFRLKERCNNACYIGIFISIFQLNIALLWHVLYNIGLVLLLLFAEAP